jgi:hypothetical protein
MTDQSDIRAHIHTLERQILQLKAFVGVLVAVLVIGLTYTGLPVVQAQSADRILRARGIVIEDEAGRARILIGAPIPAASNRVRTDEKRVRELWAGRYPNPDQYMGFYKDYRHATNGVLILDENGFDRVVVGDPVPDPNIGKRLGPSTGIVINDESGSERSGYGLLKVDGKNRVVLGLDSARGTEGLTLSLFDEGSVGLAVRDQQRLVYVGSAPAGQRLTGAAGAFHGLLVRGADGVRFVQNAAAEK